MRLTRRQLKKVIREELSRLVENTNRDRAQALLDKVKAAIPSNMRAAAQDFSQVVTIVDGEGQSLSSQEDRARAQVAEYQGLLDDSDFVLAADA